MNKDGIKEYVGIGLFVLLAIIAGGGLEGKPPEDLQMVDVIDEPTTKHNDHADAHGDDHAEEKNTQKPTEPSGPTLTYALDDLETAIDATGYSKWGEQTVIFNPTSGSFAFPEGSYEGGKITGIIDMELLIHDKQLLVDHIQEPKFFNTAEYPESTFESLRIEKEADGYKITGNLTIKGNTKTIAFVAEIEEDDNTVTVTSRNIGLKTTYWDLKYPNVKEDVKLDISLVFKKG